MASATNARAGEPPAASGAAPLPAAVARQLRERLASGTLRWGGDAEGGAPYQLRDPHDPERVIGFEVELVDAVADKLARWLGRPLATEFVQYEWTSLPLGLDKHDFDLIASGFEGSPQWSAAYRLSRPYYVCHQELAIRRTDAARITTLDDCRDRTVGTLAASAAERLLAASEFTNIVAYDGQVEPYLDLELGRVDAVLLDSPITTYYGRTNPKFAFLPAPQGQVEYVLAVARGDEALAAALDVALGEVIRNGQLREILRRWRLWNPAQAALARPPNREAELAGLGFDAAGQPLAGMSDPPSDAIDVNLVAASAKAWTFSQYAPLLLAAAGTTVALSVTSMALAMAGGLVVSLCRLYGPRPLQAAALGYVEFFRGIPLLLVLFFLYFGLAHYGVDLPATRTAVLGFGLTYAAYEAEVYRSAIRSVPRGQWEAALALGMSGPQAFRKVIFPQALRTALAPMTNDFVALFKDTSLVSVIAVRELTKEYLILSRSSLKFVELGLLTAALYLAMSIPLGYLSRWLERRWGAA
ncbi:MAG: ABC transporter substrate-binding protein/permease [Pirellulales bacterium]|nr:ABC transporter substrate-binding protein/permease [Pirellulales bacterium]